MNNSGQVVGYSYTMVGDVFDRHAFLYQSGNMQDLSTLGGRWSEAEDINNAGTVVGTSLNATGQSRAFLWNGSGMQDLGTLGGAESWGYAVNDVGQAVGLALASNGTTHTFVYESGSMSDLGVLLLVEPVAVNDALQMVGPSWDNRAMLYSGGTVQDIGTLGGNRAEPYDIDNLGRIVGTSNLVEDGGVYHAFLWEDGTMQDLNDLIAPDSGWLLQRATSISDTGYIVGQGDGPGDSNAFLLVPIPEPGTLGLLAVGLGLLIRRRRSREGC
ncbi:MAG: PEP-CTERM sorting domain-containing protein [Nitrospiraceae bacterium]|nr:PEP-CTERM sorting domain-containing protein [Nitrospiraceae bacterium]